MKYYGMSSADISGECPKYKTCRTGQTLSPDSCTGRRCNTFHQIDTIEIGNRIDRYLKNRNGKDAGHRIEEDLSRIVQKAISEMSSN